MANGLFAGIAVADFTIAIGWYERLLGVGPSFYPHDTEAVWELAENQYVYIVLAPELAGGALIMIWADDLADRIAGIAGRGLEPVELERHTDDGHPAGVGKYIFRDPDGNEISLGGELPN